MRMHPRSMDNVALRNRLFYQLKPFIPRRLQIWLRHQLALRKRAADMDAWPILPEADQPPVGWSGWPEQKKFALVLMHDVESAAGQQKCADLMGLEQQLGFRSSFNFVPERYQVLPEVRHILVANGFEVGVHGLNHDGKLFQSRQIFQERAVKINVYLKEWQAVGFCSPASHHNLEWTHDLDIAYDSSTFDTDPFEPQPDGVKSIFPFWVEDTARQTGYVELPYTLAQDFTLFILLKEKNINLWQQKLAWIVEKGGMALVITHPDYMNFHKNEVKLETYPASYYSHFLNHIKTNYEGLYWQALPKEVASFVKNRPAVC
ncbi:MAG: hypothetical protein H6632_10980 [Anaerolineales bacterium]|nr:hypothetical protein [Anaerolineales bacterium]